MVHNFYSATTIEKKEHVNIFMSSWAVLLCCMDRNQRVIATISWYSMRIAMRSIICLWGKNRRHVPPGSTTITSICYKEERERKREGGRGREREYRKREIYCGEIGRKWEPDFGIFPPSISSTLPAGGKARGERGSWVYGRMTV